MSVEVRPLGVKCNIQCHYCYQNSLRDAAGNRQKYDLIAIKAAILKAGGSFTVFGGEPLLMPKADLRDLFAFGHEHFGKNAIQTNGSLIDDDHIAMFLDYKVAVGISLDGPGDCNSPRWAGSGQLTAASTEKVERAIERLIERGVCPGIITTLHKANAGPERLPVLLDWFRSLDVLGVRAARIHPLEVDSAEVAATLALSEDESVQALLALEDFERRELKRLRFDLFKEITDQLSGDDNSVSCVWRSCDPYTTDAVRGIEGLGHTSNCGRTNKAGVDYLKADQRGYERYLALYQTPMEHGGCQGCRFFLICKGQCPGTGIDQDWRNRSDQCGMWLRLFSHIEERMQTAGQRPLSLVAHREDLEQRLVGHWTAGRNPTLVKLIEERTRSLQT